MNRLLAVAIIGMLAGCQTAEERAHAVRVEAYTYAYDVCEGGTDPACVGRALQDFTRIKDLAEMQRAAAFAPSQAAQPRYSYSTPHVYVQPGITAQDLNNALSQAFPPQPMQTYTPMGR